MLSPGPIGTGASAVSRAKKPDRLLMLAVLAFVIAAATILGALGFEYIGRYQPCHLCLMQRTPYYLGVPVAALAVVAILLSAPRAATATLLGLFALLMLYGGALGVFHSGVEWGLWPGPASCTPTVGVTGAADMLDQLENAHPPSCTEAAWRLFGLSFAGWNVVVSAILVALSLVAARMAWRRT